MLRECTIRYEALLLHGSVFHKLPPKVAESSLCAKLYFGQALGGLRVVGFSKETIGSMFPNSATKTINWLLHCKDKFKTSAEGQERGTRRQKKKKKAKKGKTQGAGSAHLILDFSRCMASFPPRMSQIPASYNTSAEEPAAISKVHLDLLDYPNTNTTQRLPLERHRVSKPAFLTLTFQARLQLASFPTTKQSKDPTSPLCQVWMLRKPSSWCWEHPWQQQQQCWQQAAGSLLSAARGAHKSTGSKTGVRGRTLD